MAMPINPGASNAIVPGSTIRARWRCRIIMPIATLAAIKPLSHNLSCSRLFPPRTQIRCPLYFQGYSPVNKDDR